MHIHKPARPVVKRSPHRNVGVIAAPWLQPNLIEWESHLERSCIYASIALWVVKKVVHQPFRVPIHLNDRECSYYPDFAVTLLDGTEIVIEVKPKKFVEENALRFNQAADWLSSRGIVFVVLTEIELRHRAWEHVYPLFLRYANWEIDPYQQSKVHQHITDAGGAVPFAALWDGVNPKSKVPVYHMLGRRQVLCDPRKWQDETSLVSSIDPKTRILVERGEYNEHDRISPATNLFLQWFGVEAWRAPIGIQAPD